MSLLEHHEKVFIVFESLVYFDDLGMIEGSEDGILAEDGCRIFDVFFFYAFDCSNGVWVVFHFGFIDGGEGSFA